MGFWLRPAADATPMVPSSLQPSRHRASPAVYGAPRAITASAERITINNAPVAARSILDWQRDAWVGYERVGEIHFSFNLLAGLLSRVRFHGAVLGHANEPPTDIEAMSAKDKVSKDLVSATVRIVHDLFAHDGPGMVRSLVLNLSVPGEAYLLQIPATKTQPARWAVRSISEVSVRGDGSAVLMSRRDASQQTTLPAGTFIARIWRRHPQHSGEPDSSMLGVADAVEELLMLQRLVRSATRSRLNAGVLFVPDGISSAVNTSATAEPPIDEQDPDAAFASLRSAATTDPGGKFVSDLMESMTRPISDESSAASVVPMVVTGAGDEGQKIRHVTFERSSDQWLVDRIEKVLERILQGIDMPKETAGGLANVRYSNAVVIDEGMYKASLEPLALVVADAFTSVFLYPMLRDAGFSAEDIARVVIWYDPSEIVTRPNSADEATQGFDRGALSSAAWRREHGYSEMDAPDEVERAMLMLSKVTTLPDSVVTELLRKSFPKTLGDLPDPQPKPLGGPGPDSGPNVVRFPQATPPAQPAADPQRTAIKQVGVT